jgi:hypothetical protein
MNNKCICIAKIIFFISIYTLINKLACKKIKLFHTPTYKFIIHIN